MEELITYQYSNVEGFKLEINKESCSLFKQTTYSYDSFNLKDSKGLKSLIEFLASALEQYEDKR